MANSGSNKELMREAVSTAYSAATGVKNTVFDITIPEGYAMELHEVIFIVGSPAVVGQYTCLLVDDPDETTNCGHTAEKTIASEIFSTQTAVGFGKSTSKFDCHKTLLVQPPNFITDCSGTISTSIFCRIWFDFVKIGDKDILRILRQQQY